MLNVMVLFGGQSNEHEVSRVSAKNVLDNMDKNKYNIIKVGITKDGRWLLYEGPLSALEDGSWQQLAEESNFNNSEKKISSPREYLESFAKALGYKSVDVVFPVLHGINCEDGCVQGFLELAGLPYVGPGVLGSAMSMDKEISKIIFEKAQIPQGKYFVLNRFSLDINEIDRRVKAEIGYPCFVKPANAGSSVGVGKAKDSKSLGQALLRAAKYDSKILVEEFINGKEIECAVLGNEDPIAAPVGEIIPSNEFYDYNAKYVDNTSKSVIPAQLPEETASKIQKYALKAFIALNCSGLSRVDFFVERDTGDIFINEINTLPGFTNISMYPMMWAEAGLEYGKLVDKLLELAVENYNNKSRKI